VQGQERKICCQKYSVLKKEILASAKAKEILIQILTSKFCKPNIGDKI
jgi:hypothetical protein